MDEKERAFREELRALMAKYGVSLKCDVGYYDDPDTWYFSAKDGHTYLTLSDVEDLNP